QARASMPRRCLSAMAVAIYNKQQARASMPRCCLSAMAVAIQKKATSKSLDAATLPLGHGSRHT
ncbi:hypothetical protein LI249_09770, partial [Dorea formicigenerans]|uniref:hypothetical protein n=1 Tax=Dorea formicigenerans TaxID=39486 RepID=UPI001D09515C